MSRPEQLQLLLNRIHRSPFNLVQTDLQTLHNFINRDQYFSATIHSLMVREAGNLGAYAGTIWKDQSKHVMNLGFIHTVAQRAALGHQLLELATTTGRNANVVGHKVVKIGVCYLAYSGASSSEMQPAIDEFAKVFLDPLVDYLILWQERDDQVLALLIRYKQRSEWFSAEHLMEIAESTAGQVEKALKMDFYEYLFDCGVDFAIDPKSPAGKGETDVMSAKFADDRRLVLEAKVFDEEQRNQSWVKKGLAQASSYAHDWSEPRAHLMIYNVVPNSVLSFSGATEHGTYWVKNVNGIPIFLIVLNLGIDITASDASSLRHIVIELND